MTTFQKYSIFARTLICLLSITLFAVVMGCREAEEGNLQPEQIEADTDIDVSAGNTVVDLLESESRFSTFVAALDSVGLIPVLQDEGPISVFAPPNDVLDPALGGLGAPMFGLSRDSLRNFLRQYIVPANVEAERAQGTQYFDTHLGEDVSVTRSQDTLTVNGIRVANPGVETSNGTVYVIDALLP